MRQPSWRPEPFACEAANRITEAASLGKQERGFFEVRKAPQAFDIPLKSRNLRGLRAARLTRINRSGPQLRQGIAVTSAAYPPRASRPSIFGHAVTKPPNSEASQFWRLSADTFGTKLGCSLQGLSAR